MFRDILQKLQWFIFEKLPTYPWKDISEWAVVGLLVVSLLWKGGKTLEITWILTAVAWLVTFVWWWERPREDAVPPLLWLGVIAFALLTVLSYLFSTTANYGLDEVLRTTSLIMIFLWVLRRYRNEQERERFTRHLAVALVGATVAAGIISVAVYALQPVNRMVGTFFDYRFHTDYWPNAWADFLLLSWPLAAWWLVNEKRFSRGVCLSLLLGFLFGVLALSFSRGAMVAFAGQLVLWGLITWSARAGRVLEWRAHALKAAVVLLTIAAVFTASNALRERNYPVQSVEEKVTFTAPEGRSSIGERAQFWGQAAALSLQRPVLGWGPYSFRFVQPSMETNVLATSDHPHNVILKYAAERGWIAALLFLALVVAVLFKTVWLDWTAYRLKPVAFLFLSLAGLLAHSMIDFNLQFVGIALPFWIFLGLLALEVPWEKRKNLNKKFVRLTEVTLISLILIVAVIEARSILISSMGRHLEAQGRGEEALQWYQEAQNQWFSRDMHLSRANILYGLERYAEASQAVEDYLNVNENDARAWKLLGDITFADGNSFDAVGYFEKAFELGHWNDIGITRSLVRAMLAAGMRPEVDAHRDEWKELLQTFVEAIQHNAHYIALSPNVEESVELANLFAKLYPKDAPLYQVLAARADHAAKIERQQILARPPGYLW
ncbi:MAG: O-antigen ligase family protein [Candidatus Peribacteraceae bacterium]